MGKKKGKGGKKKKKTTWGCQNCSSANTLEASSCSNCGEIRETSSPSKTATSSSSSAPTRSYQQEALSKYTKCLSSIEDLNGQNSVDPNVVQMLKILETQRSIYKEASEKEDHLCNIPNSIPRPVLVAISSYRGMGEIYKELGRPMPRIPKAKKNSKELVILRLTKSTTGFGICVSNGETNEGEQNIIQLCQIKWSPDMGTWDPRTWASMIAMCLLKSEIANGREIYQISCTHKLRDDPDLLHPELFPLAIAAEFRDVIKSTRFENNLDGCAYTSFEPDQDE